MSRRRGRINKGIRFKETPKLPFTCGFSADQTWMWPGAGEELHYIDETEQIRHASQQGLTTQDSRPSSYNDQLERNLDRMRSPIPSGSHDELHDPDEPVNVRGAFETSPTAYQSSTSGSPANSAAVRRPTPNWTRDETSSRYSATPTTATDVILSSPTPSVHAYPSSPPITSNIPKTMGPLQLQEACLLRHFVQNLAPAFETTDRDRHYTLAVPQRAMRCPLLMFAICTASARHLTRLPSQNNQTQPFEFDGIPLPGLDEDAAIHYHNACISYLVNVSQNPEEAYNEDTLAAATALRYYEQIDTPLTGEDTETYLNVVKAVFKSPNDEVFGSIATIQGPPRDTDVLASPSRSMRHSASLIALRQEIWSVLLYRRPFRLPLYRNNDYADLGPCDDFVWTNRILLWCADVLRFCYGDDSNVPGVLEDSISAWDRLKAFENTWEALKPECFQPIYHREPNPAEGRYCPQIWQTNDCQVLGLQHIELTRILLAVYNPRHQRLGLGASAHQQALESQMRRSTLLLCGLALSNRNHQAIMVTAAVGVSMCGEYLRDPGEQAAIINFLDVLENEHAWPTRTVKSALRDAWGRERTI